jgi:hypothetical protein
MPAHSIVAAERQNRKGAVQNWFHCQCTPTAVGTEMRGQMPEFKRGHGEMDTAGTDATRATARLPGLDIEIVHRRAVEDDAEQISINPRAAPSFRPCARSRQQDRKADRSRKTSCDAWPDHTRGSVEHVERAPFCTVRCVLPTVYSKTLRDGLPLLLDRGLIWKTLASASAAFERSRRSAL